MKLLLSLAITILMCSVGIAEEPSGENKRYVFLLSDEFLASTAEIRSVHRKTLREALMAVGICFGEGASVEIDQVNKSLVMWNSHLEARRMQQVVAASVGKSREDITKDIFGVGASQSCWDPEPTSDKREN